MSVAGPLLKDSDAQDAQQTVADLEAPGQMLSRLTDTAIQARAAEELPRQKIFDVAFKQTTDKLGDQVDDDTFKEALKQRISAIRQNAANTVAEKTTALRAALDSGAVVSLRDAFKDTGQQEAIAAGRPWYRKPEQAWIELARRAPTDRIHHVLTKNYNDDEKAAYQELLNEPIYGTGDERGNTMMALTGTGTAAQAAEGAVIDRLRDRLKPAPIALVPNPEAAPAQVQRGQQIEQASTAALAKPPPALSMHEMMNENNPRSDEGLYARQAIGHQIANAPQYIADPNAPAEALGVPIKKGLADLANTNNNYVSSAGQVYVDRLFSRNPEGRTDIDRVIQGIVKDKAADAYQQAFNDVAAKGPPAEGEINARAKQYYDALIENDKLSFLLKSPSVVRFAAEFFDPAIALMEPAAKLLGAGAGAVGKTAAQVAGKLAPEGSKLEKAYQSIRKVATWNPEATDIAKEVTATLGPEKGEVAQNVLNSARDEADRVGNVAAVRATELQAQLKKSVKATPNGEAMLTDLIDHNAPLAAYPDSLKPAYAANKEMTMLSREPAKLGIYNDFDAEDKLQQTKFLNADDPNANSYMPRVLKDEPKKPLQGTAQVSINPSAAKRRVASENTYLVDPVAQWEAHWNQLIPRIKQAAFVKQVNQRFAEEGIIGFDLAGSEAKEAGLVDYAAAKRAEAEAASPRAYVDRLFADATPKPATTRQAMRMQREIEAGNPAAEEMAKQQLTNPKGWQKAQKAAVQSDKAVESLVAQANTAAKGAATEYQAREGLVSELTKGQEHYLNDPVQRASVEAAMQKAHGQQYVTLDKQGHELTQKLEGKLGSVKGAGPAMIVPKTWAKVIHDAEPLIRGDSTKGLGDVAKFVVNVRNNVVRPVMQVARVGATILGSPLHLTNWLVSAVGLGQVGLGARILNPKLQMESIIGALHATGFGNDAARAMRIALADGTEITLGRGLDFLDKMGALRQWTERMGLEMASGKTAKATNWLVSHVTPGIPIPTPWTKLSVKNMEQGVDTYQKLTMFLGFLKGSKPRDFEAAYEAMSKFGGNFNRLSPIEREGLRDCFMFYGWNRFIATHLTQQLLEHPGRFASWARAREVAQVVGSRAAPMFSEGSLTNRLQAAGMPYGPTPDTTKNKKLNQAHHLMDYAAARWTMDPYSMLAETLGQGTNRDEFIRSLSPLLKLGAQALTGYDPETGKPADVLPHITPEDLASRMGLDRAYGKTAASGIAKLLLQPGQRMSSTMQAAFNVLISNAPLETVPLLQRYRAMNDFAILGKIANALHGEERALGPGIPGILVTPVEGGRNVSRGLKAINEGIKGLSSSRKGN